MKSKKKKKKKTENSSEFKGFEPGYEDDKEAQIREAKRRIEEANKPFNPMDFLSTKNIIIFIIWYSLYRIFLYFNFALVFFLLTIIALIFLNLGERKPGELSAYSVFNPNQERIYGFDNNIGIGQNPFIMMDNERINNVKDNVYIIYYANKEVGFYTIHIDDEYVEIENICILKEYQGLGIGTKVINDIINMYDKDITLQYFKDNSVGNLYKRLGFIPNGENKNHYKMIRKR